MSTEIREWLTEIWEYCQEHWITVAAAAAVVLVLLVSFFLVLAAKRDDDREDDILEQENASPGESEQPEKPVERDELSETAETAAAEEPSMPAEPAAEEIADVPAETEPETEENAETAAAVCAQGVVEELVKQVEAVSGASGQKVESIELKIEKASLMIRYAGTPQTGIPETEDGCADGSHVKTEKCAVPDSELSSADLAVLQKPGSGESVKPKKFGVDNMNKARSGRVYTEEELLDQIRE